MQFDDEIELSFQHDSINMNFDAETLFDEKIEANVNILYELHNLVSITLHTYCIARL